MKKTDTVCYSKDAKTIIDLMVSIEGKEVGLYSRETVDSLKARYPDAQCADLDAAHQVIEAEYVSRVEEIDEESYMSYLGALPPVGMRTLGKSQSFKMSERRFGRVTLICAQDGDRYFKFHDLISMPHDEVMAKVRKYLTEKTVETPQAT